MKKTLKVLSLILIMSMVLSAMTGVCFAEGKLSELVIEQADICVPEVNAYIYPVDANGEVIQSLTDNSPEISVFLNDERLAVDSFADAKDEGCCFIVVVNTSVEEIGYEDLRNIKSDICKYIDKLGSNDKLILLTCAKTCETVLDGTESREAAKRLVDGISSTSGISDMTKAFDEAIRISNQNRSGLPARHVLVLYDKGSFLKNDKTILEKASSSLSENRLPLYFACTSNDNSVQNDAYSFAKATGGRVFSAGTNDKTTVAERMITWIESCCLLKAVGQSNDPEPRDRSLKIAFSGGNSNITAEKKVTVTDHIADTEAPVVLSVECEDGVHIRFAFSEAVVNADVPENYIVKAASDGHRINAAEAVYNESDLSAVLTLEEMLTSGEYTLSTVNITDTSYEANELIINDARGEYGFAIPDIEAPVMLGVECVDGVHVQVFYSETVLNADVPENYTVKAVSDGRRINVADAIYNDSELSAELTLEEVLPGGDYTLSIANVTDASLEANELIISGGSSEYVFATPDIEAPVMLGAEYVDDSHIQVFYSEEVLGADIPENYTVKAVSDGHSIKVTEAVYNDGDLSVKLTFEEALPSGDYTLGVVNVTDASYEANELIVSGNGSEYIFAVPDTEAPVILRVECADDSHLQIFYSEAVLNADVPKNYTVKAVSDGHILDAAEAVYNESDLSVKLTLEEAMKNGDYTLSIVNVTDASPEANGLIISDDGSEYTFTWDNGQKFPVPMKYIYIAGGALIVILAIIIIASVSKKKKREQVDYLRKEENTGRAEYTTSDDGPTVGLVNQVNISSGLPVCLKITMPNGLTTKAQITVGSSFLIGRSSKANLKLDDETVSSKHLILANVEGKLVATDNGSTNGTYINGIKITHPHPLNKGDKLRLGNTDIVVDY